MVGSARFSRLDLIDWCQAAAQLQTSVLLAGYSSVDMSEESASGPKRMLNRLSGYSCVPFHLLKGGPNSDLGSTTGSQNVIFPQSSRWSCLRGEQNGFYRVDDTRP